tara:strand:+ start:78 stop:236 length:159 start_codon:yes stop_codon:yes gene_type:complete
LFRVLAQHKLVAPDKEEFYNLTDFDIAVLMLPVIKEAEEKAKAQAKAKANRR